MAYSIIDLLMRVAHNSPGLAGALAPTSNPAPGGAPGLLNQRDLAMAALGAASAMVTPNLSRYPVSAMQRLGLGVMAGLQGLANAPSGRPQPSRGARAQAASAANTQAQSPTKPMATLHARLAPGVRRLQATMPLTLAGGWSLYGFDQRSGKPVYIGPNRALRIFG
jgi:hypothetical protein